MALEAAIRNLNTQILKLHGEIRPVMLTVMEDMPDSNTNALIEKLTDHLMELRGLTDGMISEAVDAQQSASYPVNYERMRHALSGVQEKYNRLLRMFSMDLVSYQQLNQLAKLGRERGRAWLPWANTTREGLERCQAPIYDINHALFQCWQEVAERVGMNAVNVQATSIGQFSLPENKGVMQEEI